MKLKNKILRITCDGGAATGKSTGAKLIAKKYKLAFLSSGLLYRYSSYLILKYKGLFENTLAIPAAKEMIDCFLEVLLRIDLSKSLKFLSSQQESELLNWDIEIYRQSIN